MPRLLRWIAGGSTLLVERTTRQDTQDASGVVMLGEEGCGGRSDEVGRHLDRAVLHKTCRESAIGGSRAHVMLVAREQEQQRQRAREGEAVGRVQDAACEMEGSV